MDTIEIEPFSEADADQIVQLVADRIGEEDSAEARLVLEDDVFDRKRWTVARDGDRVVSTMASFPLTFRYGDVGLAASHYEFVATARSHEGRGLVRRQFDYHHDFSAQHGELIQMIVGIPYFYRRLGYEYALPVRPLRILANDVPVTSPDGWRAREADREDLDLVMGLQSTVLATVPTSFSLSRDLWGFILDSPVYTTFVALQGDQPKGMGRVYLADGTPILTDVVAAEADTLAVLVARSRQLAPEAATFLLSRVAVDTHLTAWDHDDYTYSYYVRIPDPVALLNAIRPTLEARLAMSEFENQEGAGLISLYTSSITFSYEDGTLSPFVAEGPEPAPVSKGGAGVPPDLFSSMVLGAFGVDGLAQQHADFRPGKSRALLKTLFPKTDYDVASWVVP